MKRSWKGKVGVFCGKVGKFLSNLLFPDNFKCLFCGDDVPDFENVPFCSSCEKELPLNVNKCLICAQPIENEAVICDTCQLHKRNFKKAFCPFVYDGLVRKAILGYKDSNQRYKAKTFAKFIVKEIQDCHVKIDAVTYIPMTRKKEKERTFNQSQLLAKEVAKLLGIEVVDVFDKLKDSKSQKSSTYKERQNNMIGMYATKEKLKKRESILIVDDVMTTCATVNYCAGLLKKKVENIYVCAIARNRPKSQQKWKENSIFSSFKQKNSP